LHAWAEVYIPGAGWIGLDPTSGLFAGEGHIPLACTPDPISAAPVTGGYFGEAVDVEFHFENAVQRLIEDPRVTKPYTEEQWQAINLLGEQVDRDLVAHDVRLTMGGEPTFVSIDDMEAAEWNTAADGPHKRQLANDLVRRLHDAFGAGGILHYGQGKWYPGEQLPRWKLAAYWRTDGVALWRDQALLADISKAYGVTIDLAERFATRVAERLGLRPTHLQPAYEDAFYYLLEEGRVPANLDPLQANLKDPLERRRLAELLQRGLDTPKGYVLPLQWNYAFQGWDSAPWEFRRGHLYLIPGDSPLGLRLPLSELPWLAEEEQEPFFERSQFEDLPPLPDYHDVIQTRIASDATVSATHNSQLAMRNAQFATRGGPLGAQLKEVPRTALCIEPRQGQLFFFMPPLHYLEHYLELLAAIELTAEEFNLPVVIEGYDPPTDPRLQHIKVTPDPGVIEVNVHPA
ncbi:MAG: transglutaminase family protein, partial [Caldilineaceae bacterium]|nr:transglutaminase family protein [Caldilineaceae bacterium]